MLLNAKVNNPFLIDKYYLHFVQCNCRNLQKNFAIVYAEYTAVADFAALAGGKYLYVAPASIERVTERNDVTQFEDFTC